MGVEDPAISIDDIDINSPSLTTTHYSDQVMGGSEAAPPLDFNGMPASVLTDYTGWGQFASMVSSGLGNLDSFLYQDEVHFE